MFLHPNYLSLSNAISKEKSKQQNMMCTTTMLPLLKVSDTNALAFVLPAFIRKPKALQNSKKGNNSFPEVGFLNIL